MAQRAEPAQRGRHDVAHQRAVALGQHADAEHGLLVLELLVERTSATQHAVENIGRDPPGSETRRFGFHGNAGTGHAETIAWDERWRDVNPLLDPNRVK